MGIGQILGMAIGPNVGILIAEHYSYQLSFVVSGVVIMISGLMVLALQYKPGLLSDSKASRKSHNGEKQALRLKDFLAIELMPNAIFAAVFMLGNGLIMSFLVLMGEERGIEGVGLYFIVYAVVVLLTRPLAGKITDRKGAAFVIIPGYIFTAGAMLLIGMSYNVWPIMLAAVLFSIGAGVAMPAIQADCLLKLDRTRSGVATGTYFIGLDIGMTTGPIVGGIVASSFGFAATFYSAATLMVVGFFVYLLYIRLK